MGLGVPDRGHEGREPLHPQVLQMVDKEASCSGRRKDSLALPQPLMRHLMNASEAGGGNFVLLPTCLDLGRAASAPLLS